MCSCEFSIFPKDEKIEGKDRIEAAQKEYTKWDSGYVEVINQKSGEVDESFLFKYDEVDVLSYLHKSIVNDKQKIEFSTGYRMFIQYGDEAVEVKKNHDEFVVYIRSGKTHSWAGKNAITFLEEGIKDVKTEEKDGMTYLTYTYDANELEFKNNSGKATGFSATYCLKDDEIQWYTQETQVEKDDGTSELYSYKIVFSQKNSVGKIENPIVVTEKTEDTDSKE